MANNRKSGVLLHPTSLPGKYGIGDFGKEAALFIDFLKKGNQKLWQVLPLGPTSFGDSPYQSFSTFAGNPLLISPDKLIEEGLLDSSIIEEVPAFSENKVEYGKVIGYKESLYKKAFCCLKEKKPKKLMEDFLSFCDKNAFWLEDYSLFIALKEYFIAKRKKEGFSSAFLAFSKKTESFLEENVQKDYYFGAVWSTWPKEIAFREKKALADWKKKLHDEMFYHQFLQFLFFKQYQEVKEYANENGIKIIGDIPIFVAYDSADVWCSPHLFYMDKEGFPTLVAGVPPDYFSQTGQLWGNPLYQWKVHADTNYDWWIKRIRHTLFMVDIVRIDHFRGFDSFWAVPFGDKDATGGSWRKGPGVPFFKAVEKALKNLPIIAEDLGIITESVRQMRKTLGYPGMRILQFAFDDSENNDYLPHNYDKNTVVYTGTHDNDTTLGWYEKASEAEKDAFRRYMNVSGEDVSWDMIRLACASAADISIYPLQDVLKLDSSARMNTPSTPSGNWRFRFSSAMLKEEYAEGLRYLTKVFKRQAD